MPSKVRDSDRDRPRDSPKRDSIKSEKREHHRSSHRKSSTKDHDKPTVNTSTTTLDSKRRSSLPSSLRSDDATTNPTMNSSKTSLPYPSFSKAHSKESVRPENIHVLTPDPTDLNTSKAKSSSPKPYTGTTPPSPPLTNDARDAPKKTSYAKPAEVESALSDKTNGLDDKIKAKIRHHTTRSTGNLRTSSDVGSDHSSKARRTNPSTPVKTRLRDGATTPQRSASQPHRVMSPVSSVSKKTSPGSDATSIAPNQPSTQRPSSFHAAREKMRSSQNAETDDVFVVPDDANSTLDDQPPPPPPPPIMPINIPRVDYLLQNGGLRENVPKNLLHAGKPMVVQQALSSPNETTPLISNLFEPYNKLLDDYENVMSKNGSLAVAIGHRSVARRLLDRLEAVFARDISSESCRCCMCRPEEKEDVRGVSWGEVLELVSGRRELPTWPPFAFVPSSAGLGVSLENHIPMQKLDIDVPEEYREHYVRQSRKTKQSVDKWLARQTEGPTSPPAEVDDETLTFAILTHLGAEKRPLYASLLGISLTSFERPLRAPTPQRGPTPLHMTASQTRERPEHLIIAGKAVQRLYRIANNPRDPETAVFLLNNPDLHDALATLAAISNDEWDILISGRFDGFLRSGADDAPMQASAAQDLRSPSRNGGLRGPTPIYGNGTPRTATGGPNSSPLPHHGAPIAYDEEMEITTLAEIERDIYQGMEALEDAFEALHRKAETVRKALRDRGVGLTVASQRRRGVTGDNVEVRTGTPANGFGERWESETDDGLADWDGVSELAPDDSASNVSSSRRRRPKRRTERRTPALMEEDEDEESDGTASPRKR